MYNKTPLKGITYYFWWSWRSATSCPKHQPYRRFYKFSWFKFSSSTLESQHSSTSI